MQQVGVGAGGASEGVLSGRHKFYPTYSLNTSLSRGGGGGIGRVCEQPRVVLVMSS